MNENAFNKKLDTLLDVIVETILGAKRREEAAAVALWPIPTPLGMLYWGNEWSRKLYRIVSSVDRQKIGGEELREAIKFPSRIAHILWRIDAIKNSGLTKSEKLYIVEKLFDYLAIFRKDNLWCADGRNIIWELEEIENGKKGLLFFTVEDEVQRKLLSNFEAILFLYTELLYWANHPIGHSFHGPYENGKRPMLVREYFDLKPEVWDFSKDLSFSQVEIFEVYKEGSEIKLDFFERGIRTTESFKQSLMSFALRIDGNPVNQLEQLSDALSNLGSVIERGSEFIQSLDEQQLIEKHAEYWFYALNPVCDLVNEDWHPPQSVRDNVYKRYDKINGVWEGVIKKNFEKTAGLPIDEQENLLKKNFDPRI